MMSIIWCQSGMYSGENWIGGGGGGRILGVAVTNMNQLVRTFRIRIMPRLINFKMEDVVNEAAC